MSRVFTIKELNEKIDELIDSCDEAGKETIPYNLGYVAGLNDLKLELNSPEPIVNVTEKVQESLNVIQTKKIINDELQ